MFWCCLVELDVSLGLWLILLFGALNVREAQVGVPHLQVWSGCWCVLMLVAYSWEGLSLSYDSMDLWLGALTWLVLRRFQSWEVWILLMVAFLAQVSMLHSGDLMSFYVCLEMQTFSFMVLCGLQGNGGQLSFSAESTLSYVLVSAFASGLCLYGMSGAYIGTGSLGPAVGGQHFFILLALMFKLHAAPLHLWVVNLYASLKKPLLMYLSTAPKLSIFCFWVQTWQQMSTDMSVGLYVAACLVLGSVGAYAQCAMRAVFAYSTVNEMGLLLLALESAGFHSVSQHLGIYVVSQLLLWNLTAVRLGAVCAVSLAGLPPLAGFFGKAWILWHAVDAHGLLLYALAAACTGLSLVYYVRLARLFWHHQATNLIGGNCSEPGFLSSYVVFLGFMPLVLLKPWA